MSRRYHRRCVNTGRSSGSSIIETLVAITLLAMGGLATDGLLNSSLHILFSRQDHTGMQVAVNRVLDSYRTRSFQDILRALGPDPRGLALGTPVETSENDVVTGLPFKITITPYRLRRLDIPDAIEIRVTTSGKRKNWSKRTVGASTIIANLGT